MKTLSYTFMAMILSLVGSAYSQTLSSPSVDIPAKTGAKPVIDAAAPQFYSVQFTIRENGKIIAKPYAIAKAGALVSLLSSGDTKYKLDFNLADNVVAKAKSVFGKDLRNDPQDYAIIEVEYFRGLGTIDTGKEMVPVIAPQLLVPLGDTGATSKMDLSSRFLQNEFTGQYLDSTDITVTIAKAKPSQITDKVQQKACTSTDLALQRQSSIFDDGADGDDCCSTGCVTCCGAGACCGDPWNCTGGCCN